MSYSNSFNNIIKNQREIANEMNKYYCQLGKKLSNKIKKYIDSTDYPLQPTYQRYFGKVVNNFNRQIPARQTIRNIPTLPTTTT